MCVWTKKRGSSSSSSPTKKRGSMFTISKKSHRPVSLFRAKMVSTSHHHLHCRGIALESHDPGKLHQPRASLCSWIT